MSDQHSTSTQEFNNSFEKAIQIVDGPHPERSVQLLEDLLLEAFEFHVIDDQIIIQLRMYLGSALWRSGLHARAVPILEAALEDAVRTRGWESRDTFSCAGNLCRALGGVGRLEEALRLAKMTYDKRVAVFGELDNGTLNSLGHLANLYFDVGNFNKAISLMSAQLEKRIEAFGEHDSRTRSSKYNLTVMRAQRDNNEQDLLDLLVKYTDEFGAEHPNTIGVWEHIAGMFERNGLLEEALAAWREVELKSGNAFGEVALPTLNAVRRRLQIQQALGDDRVANHLVIVKHTISRITGQDV
jgi:tetratricopeptide (TPR) repeat protein